MKRKIDFILIVGLTVAMGAGIFLFLDMAWALDANAIGPHPAFQNEGQLPSRALFKDAQGGAQGPMGAYGRDTAMAKMNQMMFRENIQALTAPNAFRAQRPVVPERPNPNRIVGNR